MAYHPYGDVPTFDIPDNVQVQVATHGPWGILNEADMTKQLDKIRGWTKKLGRKVWLWDYAIKWSTLTLPNVPHGTPKAWAKFYASLAPYIGGAFVESSSDRSVYNFLCYYIFGKVSWNPACDWQRMLDEYYSLMFGPAAEEMREFDGFIEEKWLEEIAGRTVDTPLGPVGCPPGPYEFMRCDQHCAICGQGGAAIEAESPLSSFVLSQTEECGAAEALRRCAREDMG